jgi:O-antigen/teichoic acid export membrane protein
MAVWKAVYANSTDSSIKSVVVMTSVSFISTVMLLGAHTNLGNQVIDRSSVAQEEFTFSLTAPLLILVLSVPLLLVFSPFLFSFFLIPDKDYFALIILVLAITALAPSAAFQSVLIAKNQNIYVSLTPVIGSFFSLGMCLITFQSKNPSLSQLYFVLTSSSFLSTLLLGVRAFKLLDLRPFKWNLSGLRIYSNIGSLLISVSAPLAFQLDRVLIAHLGELEDSLKSAPVNRIVSSVLLVLSSAGMAFWPQLRLRKDNQIVRKYTLNSVLTSIPFIFAIFLFGPRLVAYVTNQRVGLPFRDQCSIALFIFVYSSAIVPMIVLSDVTGQVRVFIFTMLSSTATIPISYFLIPKLGLSGYYYSASISIFALVTVPLYLASIKTVFLTESLE